jgi:hypothetical protein
MDSHIGDVVGADLRFDHIEAGGVEHLGRLNEESGRL